MATGSLILAYELQSIEMENRVGNSEMNGEVTMNILFASDGTPASNGIFEAIDNWFPKDAQLYGITVAETSSLIIPAIPTGALPYPSASLADLRQSLVNRAEEIMTDAIKKIEKHGRTVKEYYTPAGHTAEEIIKHAQVCKADVIVIGTKGIAGMAGWIFGSNAQKVAHYAPCSVLVVKKEPEGAVLN